MQDRIDGIQKSLFCRAYFCACSAHAKINLPAAFQRLELKQLLFRQPVPKRLESILGINGHQLLAGLLLRGLGPLGVVCRQEVNAFAF